MGNAARHPAARRSKVARIIGELTALQGKVPPDSDEAKAYLAATAVLIPITEVAWPPDNVLRAMMREGSDTWIAELLGRAREEVRCRRTKLGIPPRRRGGSTIRRKEARARFMARWAAYGQGGGSFDATG